MTDDPFFQPALGDRVMDVGFDGEGQRDIDVRENILVLQSSARLIGG